MHTKISCPAMFFTLALTTATWAADVQINTDENAAVADPAVARQSTGEAFFAWTEDQSSIVGRRYDASGQPIDAEPFDISTSSFGLDGEADVAMNDSGQAVVVWRESVGGGNGDLDVFGRLYTLDDSTPPSDVFQVNLFETSQQRRPQVVMDAVGNFTVVYQGLAFDQQELAVIMRRFDATGQPLDNEQEVHPTSAFSQFQPDLAMGPSGELAVSWTESTGVTRFFVRLFDASGTPTSDATEVLDGSFSNAVAVSTQGNILAVTGGSRITGRLLDDMGMPLGNPFFISDPDLNVDEPMVIALASGGFHVVWEQNPVGSNDVDLYGRIVQDDGTLVGAPSQVTATRQGIQSHPELAVQGDEILVAFSSPDSSGAGIFSTCLAAAGCTEIFLNGFESGNTSQWDNTLP